MSLPLKSQSDLYTLFMNTLQDTAPELTDDSPGSIDDILAGTFSIAGMELERYIVNYLFNKCFIDLADGPEITGGPDDLQTLAVDRYGSAFARPGAIAAIDTETFSRPFSSVQQYGAITIPINSVVKTQADANGNVQRYVTGSAVTLTASGFAFTVTTASATAGDIYSHNGKQFTVKTTLVAGTTLHAYGTGLPLTSGTLTKVSGAGDATIVFSAYSVPSSDTTIPVSITAVVAGAAGDAVAGAINVIESTLLDPTIVAVNAGNATGEDAQDDATYRETIRNLVIAFRAAVKAAIRAAALGVPGVVVANPIEIEKEVIFWDSVHALPVGESFFIPYATLYIADKNGSASGALISAVRAAVDPVRAYGVYIAIVAAVPITINWTAHLTFNPDGPNFAVLSANPSAIINSMTNYIVGLGNGNNFIVANANAAIMAIWGPLGTNDLVAFATTVPSGDVSVSPTETPIPGTVGTV